MFESSGPSLMFLKSLGTRGGLPIFYILFLGSELLGTSLFTGLIYIGVLNPLLCFSSSIRLILSFLGIIFGVISFALLWGVPTDE
jgi:hypothetical protein